MHHKRGVADLGAERVRAALLGRHLEEAERLAEELVRLVRVEQRDRLRNLRMLRDRSSQDRTPFALSSENASFRSEDAVKSTQIHRHQ